MLDAVVLDHDLTGALDLDGALEAAEQGNLFPSRLAWAVAKTDGAVAANIRGALSRGWRPAELEVVRVPKLDRSTRPAVDMPLEDRIVFAALAEALMRAVHPGLVSFTGLSEEGQSYSDFERFPLTQDDVQYVLEADVASFYEYVDHERLGEEIVGLTGLPDLADGLADLLQRWMGRPFGLPQGPPPSSILADVYISPAARAMARAGFRFARYSDDFRIVARDWTEARRAQLILETSLRAVGLVVAPRKLRTPKVDTYRAMLERVNDPRLRPVVRLPAAEDLLADEYPAEEAVDPRTSSERVAAAELVLRELREERRVGVVETRLVRAALRRLRGHSAEVVVDDLPRLLTRYAHLTQAVSANLRLAMTTNDEEGALAAIEEWLRGQWFKYPWQIGWMLHAANHADGARRSLGEWARDAIFDQGMPWFARGQAAIAAAWHADLPPVERYFDAWERAPEAVRPDLLAAVVLGRPHWADRFVEGARTSVLLTKVAERPPDELREWL